MQAPPAAQPAPVQEPVAWTLLLVGRHNGIIGKAGEKFLGHPEHYDRIDVYTAPPAPQRTWVGLTNEEMSFLFPHGKSAWVQETVKIIETKLRSKNENL